MLLVAKWERGREGKRGKRRSELKLVEDHIFGGPFGMVEKGTKRTKDFIGRKKLNVFRTGEKIYLKLLRRNAENHSQVTSKRKSGMK